jgi:hypothetical protein
MISERDRTSANETGADDITCKGRHCPPSFLHRRLGSNWFAGEESDCSGKNDTGYESEGILVLQRLLNSLLKTVAYRIT